jgi:2-methylcitrate dehydratase PrpD
VLSTKQDYSEILEGLGTRWESALNTYKPFACGIVIHPVIDACSQINRKEAPKAADIASVELRVHPLVLELTGKLTPQTGLEGKFSVYHSAAYALLHADGAPTAFTDRAVRDSEVIALRGKVRAQADAAIHEASAKVAVTLNDGRRIERDVLHAVGSLEKPLSDADISEKFLRQSAPILGDGAAKRLLDMAWSLETQPSAAAIARAGAAHS